MATAFQDYHARHGRTQFEIFNQLWSKPEFQATSVAFEKLCGGIRRFPHNPKFLAIFYAEGVYYQTRELTFALAGMRADAELRDKVSPPNQSEELFLVGYFAGDALYRLISIKDKMLAGLYCSFYDHDPEEKSPSWKNYKRLKTVLKRKRLNALMRQAVNNFLRIDSGDHWRRVELFRHMKTHRLEPKIQFKIVDPSRDWIYPKKIGRNEALKRAERDAKTGYGERYQQLPEDYKQAEIQRYLKLRRFGNGYFDQEQPISRLISYPDLKNLVEACLKDVIRCSTIFFKALPESAGFRDAI